MPNRLADEPSPYLLQHRDNPVDWHPWGDEAFARARAHDRPIFLSVGYSTCHWCHVMEHESFENEDIARVLNESFVPVKGDREGAHAGADGPLDEDADHPLSPPVAAGKASRPAAGVFRRLT